MTRCRMEFEELSALVDGELDPARARNVRQHLDGCDDCKETIAEITGLKRAVSASFTAQPVPPELRSRIERILLSSPVRREPRLWIAGAVALVVVLAFGLWLWTVNSMGSYERMEQALVADHLEYLGVADPAQVVSADPALVADSMRDKVGFPIEVPALPGAALLGARLCRLGGHESVLSFYKVAGRRVSVFALNPKLAPSPGRAPCRDIRGYAVCTVEHRDALLAVVADRDEAREIARELAAGGTSHGVSD